ncbi:MAG: cytochrome ubiquinol oxidase subunit I [Limosilactobacillus oris]|jgi:cytochrome d ubiquinol oxidase subunit I|uniref:cytochrome ubiquinol oxidase subunit I n=1 Tax=Limosilactobacillus oris TaxID=1632 RepID=UPI002432BDE6|nr:cytochrome ubiquinol oxidase subunit I [Limosilactobacillus oris]MCH3911131.1 cytochrome ubiquinol oxidase subunit I [Limosilactobacillus oris]MCH3938382.1 cytochrome ubiquinol oxidase subunit I [Limosilactobacillus oris]MCI1980603.1 cytochrome ubiquinol oxidase subunit I [Limosilactobacillus oris]MCI2043093.1 cytochrome ubiquinol oxidase subunit I [Limosilactobacillus oris]
MDIVSLARFQFAMTTVFHFFFVPFTIGTGLVVAIMESMYVHTNNPSYKKMTKFWGNIFLLSFAVGVVTGLIQEFQFGMNWSDYSRFMGDIFGAPLAFEALLSFFIESTFIGLWVFTWDRVKKGLHLFFMWMIVFGTMTSALWILSANSFMQHPVGFTVRNGRAEMVDFGALLSNPQLMFEYSHVLLTAILTGATIITGLAAFQLLKKRALSDENKLIYHKTMRIGLTLMLIFSLGAIVAGDMQMQYLIKEQPMKFAATEAVYKTTKSPAPWTVVGIADTKTHQVKGKVEIPGVLSVLSYHKLSGSVEGMEEINAQLEKKYGTHIDGQKMNYYVPVNTLFWSFRVMCGFGALLFLVSIVGLIMTRKSKPTLYNHRWMLWVLAILTFSPFLANTAGWFITEFGRAPWTVYGLFTIAQSVSPNVSVASLLTSNIVYFVLFTVLAIILIALIVRFLRNDPVEWDEAQADKKATDPFAKGAF